MLRRVFGELISNANVTGNIYDMRVAERYISEAARPGQFVNIYMPRADLLLPRPLSVCETYADEGAFRIIYQAMGEGTNLLASLKPGDKMRMTGPAGNGFVTGDEKRIMIAGGGIGVPPLLALARKLKNENAELSIFLGFKNAGLAVLEDEFLNVTGRVYVSTDDGSAGFNGFITEHMRAREAAADVIYACGPLAMLKSVAGYAAEINASCYVSMEERMACGIGACVGCAVKIKKEGSFTYKKVCSDGPVFGAGEVCWDG